MWRSAPNAHAARWRQRICVCSEVNKLQGRLGVASVSVAGASVCRPSDWDGVGDWPLSLLADGLCGVGKPRRSSGCRLRLPSTAWRYCLAAQDSWFAGCTRTAASAIAFSVREALHHDTLLASLRPLEQQGCPDSLRGPLISRSGTTGAACWSVLACSRISQCRGRDGAAAVVSVPLPAPRGSSAACAPSTRCTAARRCWRRGWSGM
jgi:hypothetical protein